MLKDLLRSTLLETKGAKSRSRHEISVRCPYCGDSANENHSHFYIEISPTKEYFSYDCKKCPRSGIMTPNTLKDLGIYNSQLVDYIKANYLRDMKKIIKNSNYAISSRSIPTEIRKKDQFKIDYLNSRLDLDFSKKKNLEKYKVILNLNDFIKENHIDISKTEYGRKPSFVKMLNDDFVGFLSANGTVIYFRMAQDVQDKRRNTQWKMVLPDETMVNSKYGSIYTIGKKLDIVSMRPKIVLAEGTFDIINAASMFYDVDDPNILFVAVGSSGSFRSGLLTAVSMSTFFGCDVDIISDSDISKGMYENKIFKGLTKSCNMRVIYNEASKDFGDLRKEIKTRIYSLVAR